MIAAMAAFAAEPPAAHPGAQSGEEAHQDHDQRGGRHEGSV
jgi:hypothetical protein